jgi:hypothetical protein
MKATAEVQTKEVVEFGRKVTLYRIIDSVSGKGTLWHSDLEKTWAHFARLRGAA